MVDLSKPRFVRRDGRWRVHAPGRKWGDEVVVTRADGEQKRVVLGRKVARDIFDFTEDPNGYDFGGCADDPALEMGRKF